MKRLWFIAQFILMEHRMGMSPVLFKSLLFLRVNEKFWDIDLVAEAMRILVKSTRERQ